MERHCVVPGCFSTDSISFFQFPLNNRELLQKWIASMNSLLIFSELNISEVLVCERHFDDSKIVRRNGYIQGLIPDAVPSIFHLPDAQSQLPIIEEASAGGVELQNMVQIQENPNIHQQIQQHQLQIQQQQMLEIPIETASETTQVQIQEQLPQSILEENENGTGEVVVEKQQGMDGPTDGGFDCRFCLRGIQDFDMSIVIDPSIKKHYKNLTNTELKDDPNYSNLSCRNCYNDIKKSSQVKSKVILNQRKLTEIVENKDEGPIKVKQEFEDDFFYSEGNLEVQIQENESIKEESIGEEEDNGVDDFIDQDDGDYETDSKKYLERKLRLKRSIRHKRNRNKDFSYTTDPDNKNDDKKRKLQRKYDSAKQKILCTDCGQYFSRGSIRFHHLRIHKKTPKFQCDLCDKLFYRKEECRNHMKTHSKSRTKDVSCELCTKQFTDIKNLKMHIKKFHLKIGNICCELCGKSFTNIVNYQNHMRSNHTLERAFKCDECECSYFSKGDLVDHKNRCHSNEPALCTICNKLFTSKVALRNHTKRIHAEHTFICSFESCGKKFVNNHLLQKHQKVHLGLKDHECQLCGMRYYRNFDLKRHILNIHMKVKIPCELSGCKSLFARKETYRNHIITHHKEIGEENVQMMLIKIRNMQLPKPTLEGPMVVE